MKLYTETEVALLCAKAIGYATKTTNTYLRDGSVSLPDARIWLKENLGFNIDEEVQREKIEAE